MNTELKKGLVERQLKQLPETELIEALVERQLKQLPKTKIILSKKDVANKDKVPESILDAFSCKVCKQIPCEPLECRKCSVIFCKSCSISND